ncbi:hypothetical protein KZZ52_15795 [Dactylosporangium sp. AC04546]|nr:hypothetical protein [Dactylosporangium sp. AC04546]WVK86769.1 hypothetical protein KZZ52_15795 [Dactylosporangium sp. AC04546]
MRTVVSSALTEFVLGEASSSAVVLELPTEGDGELAGIQDGHGITLAFADDDR